MKRIVSLLLCTLVLLCTPIQAGAANQPQIADVKAAVLMDISTGEVLYAMHENEKLYPASITKIMSLIIIIEAIEGGMIHLDDKVAASKNAVSYGGSQIWLKEGEQMTVDELLKAVIVASANDACTALGEYTSGSSEAFTDKMNQKAAALGMKNTHFENCTGLDEEQTTHLSTAFDIALMSKELMRYPLVQKYSTIWMDSLRGGKTMLVNTNRLVRDYDGCIGLKTGTTTKAGFCVSAVAKRGDTTLCAVILGAKTSEERFESAAKLFDFGFANFETVTPHVNLSQAGEVSVVGGTKAYAPVTPANKHPVFTVEKGMAAKLTTKIALKNKLKAPIEKGASVGNVQYYVNGKLIGTDDIVVTQSIEKLNLWQMMHRLVKSLIVN